jgi:short-chain fatty acids transporter
MANLNSSTLERFALKCSEFSEKWFPDSWVFAALTTIVVAICILLLGASPKAVAIAYGEGFWNLTTFTMQMVFVVVGGYVVASSPPVEKLIEKIARIPNNGKTAVVLVALFSMLASLLNWGLSLVFGGLLVRAMARRTELKMDYRAAGAAAYLGLGAVWALGLSSSAAQLQANPASLPPAILSITGVIPFTQTIFLWQSGVVLLILVLVSLGIAYLTAPSANTAKDATACGADVRLSPRETFQPKQPAEWLEHTPLLVILLVILTAVWLFYELTSKPLIYAISGLNTYNLLFLTLGALLHWRPKAFLDSVAKAVPACTGIIIQYPFYGSIAAMMTLVKDASGQTLAHHIAGFFIKFSSHDTFALVVAAYSAIFGFLVPSGGGKWIIEAPYVMQAANELNYHLGWVVQIYNAAEALPYLIHPLFMLPLVGILGLKAKDLVGFSFVQLLIHIPLVFFLLWFLGNTLSYIPPIMPTPS